MGTRWGRGEVLHVALGARLSRAHGLHVSLSGAQAWAPQVLTPGLSAFSGERHRRLGAANAR